MKLVHTVSGKDIANLLEQWSCRYGVPRFTASYSYVRKKNIIEFQLKQEVQRGGAKFVVSEGEEDCEEREVERVVMGGG